jgi:hypothetical protein
MGSQLAEQIESLKQQLGYGNTLSQTQGNAASGWGLGTSPYAVSPAPAPDKNTRENRQGDESLKDTKPTSFEPLYAPEDYATRTHDERVKGQLDLRYAPGKVEETRSAPETQQALTQYSNVVGAYVDSEESAIQREEVPLEYQELVKHYFEQIDQSSAPAQDAGTGNGKSAKDKNAKPGKAGKPKKGK